MENIGGLDDQARLDTEFLSQYSPLGPGHTGRSDEDRIETNELTENIVHDDNVHDSPLGPGNTGRSDETIMQLIQELTVTCTNLEVKFTTLEDKVLNLSSVVADQNLLILNLQKQIRNFKKSISSISLKRLKKVGTSQVVSSPDISTHLEEDASKQGRNEETMGSGETKVKKVDCALVMNEGMVSEDVPVIEDMDVESPQDAENFVIADKSGNEVVMEKVIATQEKVVEQLKTLEPEQLVKATGLMGETLRIMEC
jgi:bacillopeptidase F (M6 metalloprotease family)